jgi:hypothetical protein
MDTSAIENPLNAVGNQLVTAGILAGGPDTPVTGRQLLVQK